MKTRFINILSVALFLIAGFAWAHEPDPNISGRSINITEKSLETQDKLDKREEVRTNIQDSQEELRQRNLESREALRRQIEERKEGLKVRKEEKKQELKDQMEQNRKELKKQLGKVKDERKKETVERINAQIGELNERLTNHYLNVLEKFEGLLVRIAERADNAEEKGIDVSAVRTAINEANLSIAAAKEAIEIQSGKIYTIDVTNEKGLKNDVGITRRAFHSDIVSVRETVKVAHDAVRNSTITLANSIEMFIPTPTPTVTPTP